MENRISHFLIGHFRMVGRGFDFTASAGADVVDMAGGSSSFDKSIVSFSLPAETEAAGSDCNGCALVDGEAETLFDIMLTELFICNF